MKKHRPITPSALLEGLGLFLTMMNALDQYSIDQLQVFKQSIAAFWGNSVV